MTFAERHAQIDMDPLEELRRRTALWASCPGSDGAALEPAAQIVPHATLDEAIEELTWLRRERMIWHRFAGCVLRLFGR